MYFARKLLVAVCILPMFLTMSACDDEDPYAHLRLIYRGENGFMMTGAGYHREIFDCNSTMLNIHSTTENGEIKGFNIDMSVVDPEGERMFFLMGCMDNNVPLRREWIPWSEIHSDFHCEESLPDIACGSSMYWKGIQYYFVNGWTRINEIGDHVRGEFRGKLRSMDKNNVEFEIAGKFNVSTEH